MKKIGLPSVLLVLTLLFPLIISINYIRLPEINLSVASFLLWGWLLIILLAKKEICIPKSSISLLLGLFFIWITINCFLSKVVGDSLFGYFVFLTLFVAFFAGIQLQKNEEFWGVLWLMFFLVGVIFSIIVLATGILHPGALLSGKPVLFFLDKNTLAGILDLILFPQLAIFLCPRLMFNSDENFLKITYGIGIFIIVLALTALYSRGVILAGTSSFLLFVVCVWRKCNKRELIFLMGIIAAAVFTGLLFYYHPSDYLSSNLLLHPTTTTSFSSRASIWTGVWELFHHVPWYGTGLLSLPYLSGPYLSPYDNTAHFFAHNDYLQFLIELGIPGIILFIGFFLAIGWQFMTFLFRKIDKPSKEKQIFAIAFFCGMLTVAIHCFFTFLLYIQLILIIAGFYLACFYGLTQSMAEKDIVIKNTWKMKTTSLFGCVLIMLIIMRFTLGFLFSEMAYVSLGLGHYEETLSLNNLAIKIYPVSADYINLADVYTDPNFNRTKPGTKPYEFYYDQAKSALEKAITLNPYRAQTYYLLGNLYANKKPQTKKDLDNAKAYYEKALEMDPFNQYNRIGYAKLLVELKQYPKAYRLLRTGMIYQFSSTAYLAIMHYLSLYSQVCEKVGNKEEAKHAAKVYKRFLDYFKTHKQEILHNMVMEDK